MRKISIIRPKSAFGAMLKFLITLDGKKAGTMKSNSRIDLEVDENEHTIVSKTAGILNAGNTRLTNTLTIPAGTENFNFQIEVVEQAGGMFRCFDGELMKPINGSRAHVGCLITQKLLDPQLRARILEVSEQGLYHMIGIVFLDDAWEMHLITAPGKQMLSAQTPGRKDELICREAYLQDPSFGSANINKIFKAPFGPNQKEDTMQLIMNEFVLKVPGFVKVAKNAIRFAKAEVKEVVKEAPAEAEKPLEEEKESEKSTDADAQAPVGRSIYQIICGNMTNGKLNDGFDLNDVFGRNKPSWAPGAKDGILLYHMGRKPLDPTEIEEMGQAIKAAASRNVDEADRLFAAFCEKHRAVGIVDELQHYVIENQKDLDQDGIFDTAGWMIICSSNIECVKIGMELRELFGEADEKTKAIIRLLGQYDEFTIFAVWNMQRWKTGNEEIFNLAQKVHGWGRIHSVARLKPETKEIKDWLLREGTKNEVLYTYSSYHCWVKSDAEKLLSESITYEQFEAIATLIEGLLDEGPVRGISALENQEDILSQFLEQAEQFDLSEEDYDIIEAVKTWAEDEEHSLLDIVSKCEALLNS